MAVLKLCVAHGAQACNMALPILADVLLKSDDLIPKSAHPEMYAMWMWHAMEENEHKAVCYDVYQAVTQGPAAYLRRTGMMAAVTVLSR